MFSAFRKTERHVSVQELQVTRDAVSQEEVETYVTTDSFKARVQPLSIETAEKAGLTGTVGRWVVFHPPGRIIPMGARLRWDGEDFRTLKFEPWPTFPLVIVEELP
ncbi:hypothetical protein [Deinococcus peraridilitoris]|uniref:Uncharacterized protein n=1 Tax=Deinococcus peraridilitoris (strain DSM 19664 / LMG 22246 / CIP 109416 / KR-200) TaxID=937777 RepID=K9ZXZ7_DEIPD|nr:hypothetical protein [Deinococcus peraridilitoris]AFZ66069.1 hypothetical protein Deipe_0473 [Deinococcus peraridilitoris DSM 19664]